jgi:geranylgeranyl diphosphate synthase, type II
MARSVAGTSTANLQDFLQRARETVDGVLSDWSGRIEQEVPGPVGGAIAYSLAAPGKRLRPALVIAAYAELGGSGDATELAASVEIIHTYSLVHDDLPCMDDDDLRRGRPTTHRRFGVATATEAGFRMVPLAARVLAAGARRLRLAADTVSAIGREVFRAAGGAGMIGGQVLDLEGEGRGLEADQVADIHRRKTGALITASAVTGALAAGAPDGRVEAVRQYGRDLGFAFQVVDDVLDATGTSEELGKTAGKDARQQKATFATVYGNEEALSQARNWAAQAVDRLTAVGIHSKLLAGLADFVVSRRS